MLPTPSNMPIPRSKETALGDNYLKLSKLTFPTHIKFSLFITLLPDINIH